MFLGKLLEAARMGVFFLFFAVFAVGCGSGSGGADGGTDGGTDGGADGGHDGGVQVSVTIDPEEAAVVSGGQVTFTATVEGATDDSVEWSSDDGFIHADGNTAVFTAPLAPGEYTVTATSVEDPAASASAYVWVEAPDVRINSIRFTTDQSLIFTATGQTHTIAVEVLDEDGDPVDGADVQFSADDPSFVDVQKTGPLTATVTMLSDQVGYTTIRATSEGAEALANAAFATVADGTVVLSSSLVLEKTHDESTGDLVQVVLERTPETEAIAAGNYVVTGDLAGVLAKVESVRLEADRVIADVSDAAFTDVFENLDLEAETPLAEWEAQIGPDLLATVYGKGLPGGVLRGLSFKCETEAGGPVDIKLTGPSIRIIKSLRARARIRTEWFSVKHFSLVLTGRVGIRGSSGKLEFSSGISTKAICTVDLPSFKFPGLPLSVLTFVFQIEPRLGAQAHATFEGPSLTFTGPSGHAIATATGGIRYENGWGLVADSSLDKEVVPYSSEIDWDVSFDAGAGPYGSVDAVCDVRAGRSFLSFSLVKAAFADIQAEGGLNLSIASPLDEADPGYQGPSWDIGYDVSSHLKAEFTGGAIVKIVKKLGLSVPTLSSELFHLSGTLLQSPKPEVSAPGQSVDLGVPEERQVALQMSAPGEDGTAAFWALKAGQGTMTKLGEAAMSAGSATFDWYPTKSQSGTWSIYGRLASGILGSVKPYADSTPYNLAVLTPSLESADSASLAGVTGENATGGYLIRNDPPDLNYGSALKATVSASAPLSASPSQLVVNPGESAVVSLSYPCDTDGDFTASLSVDSNDPELPSKTLSVSIHCGANQPPVIDLGPTGPTEGNAPLDVTVGWGVTDPENQPVSCRLDFGDATPVLDIADCAATTSADHTYTDGGKYTLVLTASDDHGGTSSAQVTIDVNSKPVVNQFAAQPAGGDPPLDTVFSIDVTDPDGDTVTCTLAPGDGSQPADVPCQGSLSHTYAVEGSYLAVLTATDDRGAQVQAQFAISVGKPPPCNVGPATIPIDANNMGFLDFGYDPVTGECTLSQFTGMDILEFLVDGSNSDGVWIPSVIDALGSYNPDFEFYMDQPQPNSRWLPNYWNDRSWADILIDTPTSITVRQVDPQGSVLHTYTGTFTVRDLGAGNLTLEVQNFVRND